MATKDENSAIAVLQSQMEGTRETVNKIDKAVTSGFDTMRNQLSSIQMNYATSQTVKEFREEVERKYASKKDVADINKLLWFIVLAIIGIAIAIIQGRLTS
jgi:low affinity Fe/Cu permease